VQDLPQQLPQQLAAKLQHAYAERLVSVVLYGSAAGSDHHPGYSDINVLCVLASITPRELAAGEDLFRWWRGHGNPSPLLLTEPEMAASTDCFAIEFLDIRRQHRLLCGKDVLSNLEIDLNRHASLYRMQVERDLRAKLFRLRQKAAGMMSDHDLLRRLLADSVSTFCVLFRHALALTGVDAAPQKRDIVERAAASFGIDRQPFDKLLDLREGRCPPRQVVAPALLGPYLQGIAKVIDVVDGLDTVARIGS
jgi:hypothetical protein